MSVSFKFLCGTSFSSATSFGLNIQSKGWSGLFVSKKDVGEVKNNWTLLYNKAADKDLIAIVCS